MIRLDKFLIENNLVPTRTKAKELIENGNVLVEGDVKTKPSFLIVEDAKIDILENEILKYVSRGGLKLEKALKVFNVSVKDKVVMDIGSSTGGFTDCCLQQGAKKVICIDVGTNVMNENLRKDKRIELHENTNFKDVAHELFLNVDLFVADVSFISLSHIIEKIYEQNVKADIITLIKPQFECGIAVAKKYNGVIKSKTEHKKVLKQVIETFKKCGYFVQNLDFSPIKGGDGNIEYLAYFSNRRSEKTQDLNKTVNFAFNIG